MAARDKWTSKLSCPKCGKAGEAAFSEDEHPYIRGNARFRVDGVSPGFHVEKRGSTAVDTIIVCSDCMVAAG